MMRRSTDPLLRSDGLGLSDLGNIGIDGVPSISNAIQGAMALEVVASEITTLNIVTSIGVVIFPRKILQLHSGKFMNFSCDKSSSKLFLDTKGG